MVYALGVLNLLFLLVGIVVLSVVNLSAAGAGDSALGEGASENGVCAERDSGA